jgi:uncharacterized hydrophobic protein (TIGR00271 family)
MLHLRLITPVELTRRVIELLRDNPAATHVIVLPGAAQEPAGDVVLCDVAREGADGVLDDLAALGLDRAGAISAESVDVSLSTAARNASAAAPGLGTDAVVWAEIEQKTGEESQLSATYLILLIVATIIASIGVLLDQPILIVGAMVVGPEFGPLAAICLGVVRRHRTIVGRSLFALLVGFAVAMLCTVGSTWVLDAMGLVDKGMLLAERPLTDFIWRPDALSWIVGCLAGVAGMISLTSAKSGALIGVLISVTTVPAAANASVAVAYGVWDEAGGSALQLLINLAAIVTAGVLSLTVQRLAWRRAPGKATPRV